LTVLLGANDVAKSTLLRALDEDLRSGPPAPVRDEMPDAGGERFVDVDERELADLLRSRGRRNWRFSSSWVLGGYSSEALDKAGESFGRRATSAEWLELLQHASDAPETFAPGLTALARSNIVCFADAHLAPTGAPN